MGYLLPVISGALLALSFPKAELSIAAWFSLAPLLYSIRRKEPGRAFIEGLAAGLVFNLASVYWVINTMHGYGGLSYPVSVLLLAGLAAYLSLYFGAFSLVANAVYRKASFWAVAVLPVIWVSLELARNYALTGFPWNLLGYSQHSSLAVIQVADITGVYGVSALIVLINAAVADIIALWSKREVLRVTVLALPVLAVFVLAATFGYGLYRLSHPPRTSGSIKVALVQGNIDQSLKWDPAYQQEVFDTYRDLTFEAAKDRPDLIIWPETATPFYYQDGEKRAELEETVRAAGTHLMTGSPSFEKLGDELYRDYNSVYLLSPDGRTAGRYDKMHLVPFGEYVPLKKLLPFVSKMVVGIGDFGTGTEYTVMDSGKGRFGTAICFEVIFPEIARNFALNGADILASVTNDAWFGRSAAPYQHFNMAVFRAVENRRTLVRAANTGITGIVLPTGGVAARTEIFSARHITAEVPLVNELSFYTRHGDLFAYGCVIISGAFLAFMLIRKKE